jgi:hypothetical protein
MWCVRQRNCLALSLGVCTTIACGLAGRPAPPPQCSDDLSAAWATDSTVALCLPPGFRPTGTEATWIRPRPDVGDAAHDLMFVEFFRWPDDSVDMMGACFFPESSAATAAGGMRVDSLVVYRDTIVGSIAQVRVGLVTGEIHPLGIHRRPGILARWKVSGNRRAMACGWAWSASTLDTLRTALSTMTLGD